MSIITFILFLLFGVMDGKVLQPLIILSIPSLYIYSMMYAFDVTAPFNTTVRGFVISCFFFFVIFTAHRLGMLDLHKPLSL
jgi:hypothetical protein